MLIVGGMCSTMYYIAVSECRIIGLMCSDVFVMLIKRTDKSNESKHQ